jgi:hypothetical protein
MTDTGKYRWRTALRAHLPWALTGLVPKGSNDCGNHEWYREDDDLALCYHCEVGERQLAEGERLGEVPHPPATRVPVHS